MSAGAAVAVIPARDEAATVGAVARGALALGFPVIVADDDSTDATAAAAAEAGATVLALPCRLGAWGATQAGLRLALGMGADIIVTLDADGQHRPEDIPALAAPVARGTADIAIGSCPERGGPARQGARRLLRALSGLSVADPTSGFRAYGRQAARAMLGAEALLADYQDLGLLLLARRRGLRLAEVPVGMGARADGSRVFPSWLHVARYLAYTAAIACARR